METRQIAAVVVIVVIIAGVGIGAWMFLPTAPYGVVVVGQLVTPGAPAGTASDRIIIVGILDPMTEIQGEGAWKGAYLACDEINTAGGVTIDGETYYFGLVSEDTFEADASLDISKGVAAAIKILTEDNAQFIMGGFRTEAVLAYQELIMAQKMLFLSTGSATDIFTTNLNESYDTYKYFFRLMPINTSALAGEIVGFLGGFKAVLEGMLAKNVSQVAIIREDLSWTVGFMGLFNYYLPLLGFNITKEIAFPITAEAADFATYWQQIEASGAQITIPIISAQGGILMTTQYAAVQPKCLIVGIDVMSQLDIYWDETGGACENQVLLQTMYRTNKTTKTLAMWDSFLDHYGSEPLYTAVGSYDAMYVLLKGIDDAQSLNSTEIIPYLEALTPASPLEGAGGHIAFTKWHDLYEGFDGSTIYGTALFCQWQAGGAKEVISSGGQVYPDFVVTAPLTLPSWGINDE